MAVQLEEFAVRATLAYLQAVLNDELAAIALERDDGIGVRHVVGWYAYDKPEGSAADVLCTVDTQGPAAFPDWGTGLASWLTGVRAPLKSTVDLSIEILFVARGPVPLNRAQVKEQAKRYAAALVRVFRNDPRLRQGEAIVATVVSAGDVTSDLVAVASNYGAARARVTLALQESSIGETEPRGGRPVSAVLEQIR